MFFLILCLFIFANLSLHDVNLATQNGGVEGYLNRNLNTAKYFQKIRRRRQSLNENDVGGELSRFPENTGLNNQGTWNFGEDEDAVIFDDGDLNFGRPSTFPRQVSFEQVSTTPPIFQGNVPPTVSTVQIPGMGTRRPVCEETCLSTPEYNPVCGDDNVTYPNLGKLQCASRCGRRVSLQFRGACLTRARGR